MDKTPQLGDFTVLGFTRDPNFIKYKLSIRLGITPQTIQIGSLGQFFFYSSYGDVAESEETVVLKLGFLRSITKSPLTARQFLDNKLVNGSSIHFDAFSGNGLVVGISKHEASFSAFQTLMSVPQLYYTETEHGILCSDVLRCLVQLTPRCELNEAILPQHYLFRSVYGLDTYFSGVNRLIPGQYLRWVDDCMELRRVRSLDAVAEEAQYIREDTRALNLLCETLEGVVGDYSRQIQARDHEYATLLSGGVDSSLVQYFLNSAAPKRKMRSISYAIQVPAFMFEVEYARQASDLFHTEHTFVDYSPQDYIGLLSRVIDILAQPPNLETEPSFLAVAEYIHTAGWDERFFLTGQGGDTLFGGEAAVKLKGVNYLRRIPGAVHLLSLMGKVLAPVSNKALTLDKGAKIIASENNPDSYVSPSNSVCVYVLDENWDIIRRSFGDRVLQETLASRRNLVWQYTKSRHYLDKVYFIDLFTDLWELGAERNIIFLAYQLEQASPFFDEDMVKMALTVHPDLRYIKGFRYKHLLRRLLEQKTNAPVARKRKGPSNVNDDLVAWMHTGSLRPLVEDIDRPSFMEKNDFDRLIKKPDYFLWPLLTLDVFQKRIFRKN